MCYNAYDLKIYIGSLELYRRWIDKVDVLLHKLTAKTSYLILISQLPASDIGAQLVPSWAQAKHSTMYPRFASRTYFLTKISY